MLKTFSIGGVHPHENKLSAHQPIITAEVCWGSTSAHLQSRLLRKGMW